MGRMDGLITGEAVALRVAPAHLAARAVSALIDVVAYVIVYILVFGSAAWAITELGGLETLVMRTIAIILTALTLVAVPLTVEVLTRGRSLGKLICGLRIVRTDGGAVTFRHSLIRALLWEFEMLATGGGVAALAGLLSPRSRRLGDMLAGTMAVSERATRPRFAPVVCPPQLADWASRADLSPLPAGLHYRIVQFLTTAHQRTEASRTQRSIELAEELNDFVAPAPPPGTSPEMFLAAVIARSRHEHAERMRRSEASTARVRERLGSLPHGLRL